MLSKSLPKLIRIFPKRTFSNFKWNIYLNETGNQASTILNYKMNDLSEIESSFKAIPTGPFHFFREVKEMTTESVVYLSETMNLGWVGGIIFGSFLIRQVQSFPFKFQNVHSVHAIQYCHFRNQIQASRTGNDPLQRTNGSPEKRRQKRRVQRSGLKK